MRWHAVNLNTFAPDWRVRDEHDEDVLTLRFAHREDHARLAAAAPEMLRVLMTMTALTARGADVPAKVIGEARRVIGAARMGDDR